MTGALVLNSSTEVIVKGVAPTSINQIIVELLGDTTSPHVNVRQNYLEIVAALPPATAPGLTEQAIVEIIAASNPSPVRGLQVIIELVGKAAIQGLTMDSISSTAITKQHDNLTLSYSDTKGASWSNPITKSLGASGTYDLDISFRRLGMSRDRIFAIEWSASVQTALTGVFVLFEIAES